MERKGGRVRGPGKDRDKAPTVKPLLSGRLGIRGCPHNSDLSISQNTI